MSVAELKSLFRRRSTLVRRSYNGHRPACKNFRPRQPYLELPNSCKVQVLQFGQTDRTFARCVVEKYAVGVKNEERQVFWPPSN